MVCPCLPLCYNAQPICNVPCFPPQELENLRKQAEIIPQLMAECESVTEKLQVGLTAAQQRSRSSSCCYEVIYDGSVMSAKTSGSHVRCGEGGQKNACARCQTDIKTQLGSVHEPPGR